jgi:glycosyltransferase involved in cell wall biosynthesis
LAELDLTILMPCLNEAETLAACIRMGFSFLRTSGVSGEVLVADNGSTDRSRDIALAEGARIVPVPTRGYGAALLGGIDTARGEYVVMGDADESYDLYEFSIEHALLGERASADEWPPRYTSWAA